MNLPTKNRIHLFAAVACLMALLALASCTRSPRRFVVGVSQCSEDVWRDKLNREMRIAAYYYNNIDLRISSANDDVDLQTEQINRFVDEKVDLLIVAPGQVTISKAIDRAYDKGIPVVIFDRRTHSDKYTAYIGADNRAMGKGIAECIAAESGGKARVVEICGLSSSSPAIARGGGFDSVAASRDGFDIVARVEADWTEQGGYRAMDSLLSSPHAAFDHVFAHNDRMAMGARKAVQRHGIDVNTIKFCGIDAMPQPGGGMQLVRDGVLMASYIYPTRGDEVMQLAMNILTGKPYRRDNQLSSALVTHDNANMLLMQNDETVRQQDHLSALVNRVDRANSAFNTQRIYLLVLLAAVMLLVTTCAFAITAYVGKTRYNRQLRQSMEQQKQLTGEMERMTQNQLRFFTNVSHELRTPLTLIAGPAEQLLADGKVAGRQRSMVEMVVRNARILTRLVGEILDFRKVQNDKEKLTLNRFDICSELAEWAADFQTVAQRAGITLHTDIPAQGTDGATVIADREKLSHIYFNLMSNALKYTPRGGTITTRLTIADDRFTISVADTGCGIDPQSVSHLFERFYQADGAVGGTGIGLALVRAYAELHHGTARAESEAGRGSTFIVELPSVQPGYDPAADTQSRVDNDAALASDYCQPADAATRQRAAVVTGDGETGDDRPMVLIIDDNNGMRAYLRSILEPHYDVAEACDGAQGMDEARRLVPQIVVSDVMMPGVDGLEFCRRLKDDTATSHIPVVLLTARSLDEQRAEGYGCGADSYITKPFTAATLLARVDNLLHSRRQLRRIFAGDNAAKDEEEKLTPRDQAFVCRLRDIIKQNLGDSDFSVERIGEEIGLSRVQLYRKVKALTGQSPVELLRKARLAKARRMIEAGTGTIAETAYAVGFSSPSYFNKCYKDEFGTSPGADAK